MIAFYIHPSGNIGMVIAFYSYRLEKVYGWWPFIYCMGPCVHAHTVHNPSIYVQKAMYPPVMYLCTDLTTGVYALEVCVNVYN